MKPPTNYIDSRQKTSLAETTAQRSDTQWLMQSEQQKPPFEIVTTTQGAVSIKDLKTGEIMHNPVGPWRESRELYVEQSALANRLRLDRPDALVLFDVGLGAAFNSLSALKLWLDLKKTGTVRPLKIISFERELRLVQFALDHFDELGGSAELKPYLAQLCAKMKIDETDGLTWVVRIGPFEEMILRESEHPEVIFFDPYSPKMNPEMWSLPNFKALRALAQNDCILLTYSISTGIRVTLLLSGFFVGDGTSTGEKAVTTVASTTKKTLANPLDQAFLSRWQKSHAWQPFGADHLSQEAVKSLLFEHLQFQNL